MKYLLLLLLCIALPLHALADNEELAAAKIDPALLVNANAVVRLDETSIEIASEKDMVMREHFIITILKEEGDKLALIERGYSSISKMSKISGVIYDKNGKEIKKIRESDFLIRSATVTSFTSYDDAKLMLYNAAQSQYPYTVEISCVSKTNQTFGLPAITLQGDEQCAVEKASLVVAVQDRMALRYKLFHVADKEPVKEDGVTVYKWKVKNLKAIKREKYVYKDEYATPAVQLALTDFKLNEYSGKSDSWENFGKFVYELNKGRDVLPDEAKAMVGELLKGAKTKEEKIAALYKYMQESTRYVSIQYGIGGWQTLDAAFVHKNKYGDCKALTNYMMSLLQVAGITSYATLIAAGSNKTNMVVKDFPDSYFNHVILNIPDGNSTKWLECTSRELPPNYLSDFTDDRDALMITPQGGKMVHTPRYDTMHNFMERHLTATMNNNGVLQVKNNCRYGGLQAMAVFNKIDNASEADIKKYANRKYALPSYSITANKYSRADVLDNMVIDEMLQYDANSLITKTGPYTFVAIDAAPLTFPDVAEDAENRVEPFYLPQAINICDTFELNIPDGFMIESVPEPVKKSFPFGSYSYEVKQTGKKAVLYRRFVQYKGIYPAALFASYQALLEDVSRGTGQKVALKNI